MGLSKADITDHPRTIREFLDCISYPTPRLEPQNATLSDLVASHGGPDGYYEQDLCGPQDKVFLLLWYTHFELIHMF